VWIRALLLWKRDFEQWPLVGVYLSPGVLVFSWPLDSKPIEALAKADPALKKARKNVANIGDAHLVQLLDAATGAVKAQRIVEGVTLPAFETAEAGGTALRPGFSAAGAYLLAASADNRLVIQRRRTGSAHLRTRHRFRRDPRAARRSQRRYGAVTAGCLRLQFPDRIVLAGSRADGGQLGVVTADQSVYIFAMP